MIRLRKRKKNIPGPEITPLLDVVFILLIFFMLTAVMAPQGIAVDLPQAASAQAQPEAPVTISLNQKEELFFNGEPIDLKELEKRLSAFTSEKTIIIQGDQKISYGLFVKVMDQIRTSGKHRIVMAAELNGEE